MIRRLFRLVISVSLLALGGIAIGSWHYWQEFEDRPLVVDQPVSLVMERGDRLPDLLTKLRQTGVLKSDLDEKILEVMIRRQRADRRLKAGEYELPPSSRAQGIIDQLVQGKVRQHSLTIVEGWNFRQMRQQINEHPKLRHDTIDLDDLAILRGVQQRLEIEEAFSHPEGLFFPDTYKFSTQTSDWQIYMQAYSAMQKKLHQLWSEDASRKLPYRSPYDALIMASIVEKETGLDSEREEIAGVFVRRLRKGMRLQTDPTVIYGIGPDFDGNIRRRDLRRDTPYNTYTRHGLTPTPIALPGERSLYAALHPDNGKSLYFVSRGDGSHQFSPNLAAHQAAVRKFQLKK